MTCAVIRSPRRATVRLPNQKAAIERYDGAADIGAAGTAQAQYQTGYILRLTQAKTKKEAVVMAIREFNRRRRLDEVLGQLGTFTDVMSQEDLRKMRQDEHGL